MPINLSQGTDDFGTRSRKSKQPQHGDGALKIDWDTLQAHWEAGVTWMRTTIQNKVRVDTIRPLPQFLGISLATGCLAAQAFGTPVQHLDKSTVEKIKGRLSLNLAYFITNYVMVAILVATVVALMHPGMILFVAILYGLWTVHAAWGYQELLLFGVELHRFLTYPLRSKLLTALTLLVVIWKCWWPAIHAVVISLVLIVGHALLRDPKHIDLDAGERQDEDEDVYTGPLIPSDGGANDEEGGMSSSESSAVLVERPTS